ncbi:single-stranded-DNA-specific exonuclease RecJ [Candidatus Dojkabacteria bacterium]|uniref:Single-stranded-DNA-specific exonuclease RecJ n=1 Tax=Candidatus Dojkabacteria bacterium TaxID=2099670 RepID=A0A847D293_9BACT|nr:single-stranded-DNA-specific exonuclease RecJ [Candidatus Dojkabacteria bacterium]
MSLKSRGEWNLPKKKKINDILEYILKSREIKDSEHFLSPSLDDIPDPSSLFDSMSAAKLIIESVNKGKKIVIHGDFDSDGICATSLLWDFLYRELSEFLEKKVDVIPYIPNRIEQGYGLTEDSLKDVLELGGELLISVDCGVRDEKLINKYKKKNLSVIITDHHQPPEDLSPELSYPLVHQMYPNHEYPFTQICGTAVVFLLIQEIRKQVGMNYSISPDSKGLDLVALATVTDLMPLTGINRIFVSYGLKQIATGSREGLRQLCLRAGINFKDINSYHLGYLIGPRINAAGRIGSPMNAVKLLVSSDEKLCQKISEELDNLNFDRQKLTLKTKEEASSLIQDEKNKAIFVIGKDWHEGIIGLVAGKLLEEFHKPVIVATHNGESVKGSARSIKGFNITEALGKFDKYLERFGGHELAAGFTAKADTIDEFVDGFMKFANKEITKEMLVSKLNIDLVIDSENVGKKLIDDLHQLEPFGYGNPKPIVCLKNLVVFRKTIMGKEENHMKLLVKGSGYDMLTLVLFGAGEDKEEIEKDSVIDVVGYPDLNVWNGNENVQFNVKEWRFS